MKRILGLVPVIALLFSLTALAGEEDFEGGTIGDWEIWDYNGSYERHDFGAPIENTTDMNYEQGGSHALRVVLTDPTDTGFMEPQFTTTESNFLNDFNLGDTVFYALYLGIPHDPDTFINVLKMFGKAGPSWGWHENGSIWGIPNPSPHLPNDTVKFGQWNLVAFVIPQMDSTWHQIGICINFNNNSAANTYSENDTIYFDAITSLGRLSGINIKDGDVVLPKTSIGSIKYSLSSTTPVLIEVFDLTGRKVISEAPGFQVAGDHELKTDGLAAGVYIVKVVAGNAILISKLITIE